jgi:hypothetical protein
VAIAVVVVAVLVLTMGGGSHKNPSATGGTSAANSGQQSTRQTTVHPAAKVNPGTVSVSVLNGTETNGLAHRIAASLKEKGYKHATPLKALPPGAYPYPKTIVRYTTGHSTDAESVAETLDISPSKVQPIEASMVPVIAGASVVVVAGEDQPTPPSSSAETSGSQSAGAAESSESGAGATG